MKGVIVGLDNGVSPISCQAIIQINADFFNTMQWIITKPLVGNEIVHCSDVVGAPTTSSFST